MCRYYNLQILHTDCINDIIFKGDNMKKRKKPIRRMALEKHCGSLIIKSDHPLLDYKTINGLSLTNEENYRVVFDACVLEKTTLNYNKFLRAEFIDCTFKSCDLSNNTFIDSTFIRCEFIDCKFVGSHIIQTHMADVLFEACNLQYFDLVENKIKVAEVNNSNLKESNWFENTVEDISFNRNDLSKSILYNNPFKNLDVSTCIIDGIKTDKKSIQGITIDTYQAQVFCHLLGIRIKGESLSKETS